MSVIKVENLSKRYILRGSQSGGTLRDVVANVFRRKTASEKEAKTLWALREVNFEVKEGETLGLIGNNGAGKSTLLKILSRITKPTSGFAELHGRVGSLLEVGTGFHQELSGRENIFLNGAILGMKRAEIEKKFDEIVEFAEVERFLETPVKYYSSGMYMRLAFAVAAHLEPEILIVDEVLAVGDMAFQRKCLSKMQEVNKSGRTVIFVSHNMQAVLRLCERCLLFRQGTLIKDGATKEIVNDYLKSDYEKPPEIAWEDLKDAPASEFVRLRSVRACNKNGKTIETLDIREPIFIEMAYEVLKEGKILTPNLHFYNEERQCVFVSHNLEPDLRHSPRSVGVYVSKAEIPGNFWAEGRIFVGAAITTYLPMEIHFDIRDLISFIVVDTLDGTSARGDYAGVMPGIVRPILNWETFLKD